MDTDECERRLAGGGWDEGGRRVEKRAGEGGCCRTASRSTSL